MPSQFASKNIGLFINGVFESVLEELLMARETSPTGTGFLQPHKGQVIKLLKDRMPIQASPVKLYMSITNNLCQICYVADIVGWEDKRELTQRRRLEIRRLIEAHQPTELNLFDGKERPNANVVNLLTVRNLRKLDSYFSTSVLVKVSDDSSLKKRTMASGWSYVYEVGDLLGLPFESGERLNSKLHAAIEISNEKTREELDQDLEIADKKPEKISVLSIGYRRNPDVISRVLSRADGTCEHCGQVAPFLRAKDHTPYLEVHHKKMLSQGGDDTVENAIAVCPNCHRQLHFGVA